MTTTNLSILARQYVSNRGKFRRYVHEQPLSLTPLLIRAARALIQL